MLAGHPASLAGSLADGFTQLGDRLGGKEGRQGFQAAGHVLVDAAAVLHHAVVTHRGAQHGVPGPVLQQQIIPLDVYHSRNVLVPVAANLMRICGRMHCQCSAYTGQLTSPAQQDRHVLAAISLAVNGIAGRQAGRCLRVWVQW